MLFVVGINHKTAPVDVRERLAIAADQLPEALDGLMHCLPDAEAVVLSTCNRVEAYLSTDDESAAERAVEFLSRFRAAAPAALDEYVYAHTEDGAIRHLFCVAAGLDSMVVGETQINSQIKEAYLAAAEHGTTGKVLNTLFQRAFAVAKEIYHKSEIGERKVSVSSVAVDLARRVFESFEGKTVMIVGAGETGELVLVHILEWGCPRVIVANRTPARGADLANHYRGQAIGLDAIPGKLPNTDIMVCCTASDEPVIHRAMVEQAARARHSRPMFIIDIAVPRDVEPAVGDLDNVYLYNIDDLEQIVARNLDCRQEELSRCMAIVDQEVDEFVEWLHADEAAPTIRDLVEAVQTTKDQELDRLRPKLDNVSQADWEQIVHMADRLANKVTHHPATTLRDQAKRGEKWYIEAARRLFGLPSAEGRAGDAEET